MRMMLIGGGLLFAAIVWGVILLTRGDNTSVVVSKPVDSSAPAVQEAGLTGVALEKEAEAIVRSFVEATTLEEMLRVVRTPEVTEARMRRFYPEGKIAAAGLSQFNPSEGFLSDGRFHSFSIITGEQAEKAVTVEKTPQGLKVDWESWVGWSDIPWADFVSTKPVTSHVFRVFLAPSDYYNFGFSDDTKWQCYRLDSPDKADMVYGYVEKNSPLDLQLRPNPDETLKATTLALKFLPDSTSGTQVIIERLVSDGWVEEGETR